MIVVHAQTGGSDDWPQILFVAATVAPLIEPWREYLRHLGRLLIPCLPAPLARDSRLGAAHSRAIKGRERE